jgi:hypothetical protein
MALLRGVGVEVTLSVLSDLVEVLVLVLGRHDCLYCKGLGDL